VDLNPLRGFRDILPPESEELSRLIDIFRGVAEAHGYLEVKPPTLERFELFAAKSGEEIRRSMYVFKDKGGREVALRPEATASMARIYLRHLRAWPKPVRVYYVVNCFRYEEPQFARFREFWQGGLEHFGTEEPWSDFEVVKVLVDFYRKLGIIDRVTLKLGSTRLYRTLFSRYGLDEEVQDRILHLMDKKMYSEAASLIRSMKLEDLAAELERIWQSDDDPLESARSIAELAGDERPVEELLYIVNGLRSYMPSLNLEVDVSFARGLAYYTGIIFEVTVPGFPVSIAGGGRYDALVEIYGGERVPGTGFAIGLDRTLAALHHLGADRSRWFRERVRVALVSLEDVSVGELAKLQDEIVESIPSVSVSLFPGGRLTKLLPRLAKQGYRYAVIVGKKELSERKVTVRDLELRKQVVVGLEELRKLESLAELFST
jgi:histidyl-tRNA synthetase